jgi:hypothetical protein
MVFLVEGMGMPPVPLGRGVPFPWQTGWYFFSGSGLGLKGFLNGFPQAKGILWDLSGVVLRIENPGKGSLRVEATTRLTVG